MDFAYYYMSEQKAREHLSEDQGYDDLDRDQYVSVWNFARAVARDNNVVQAELSLDRAARDRAEALKRRPVPPMPKQRSTKFRRVSAETEGTTNINEVCSAGPIPVEKSEVLDKVFSICESVGEWCDHYVGGESEVNTRRQLLTRALRNFETQNLKSKLAALNAYRAWMDSRHESPMRFARGDVLPLVEFLLERTQGGGTAAQNMFQSLAWWKKYAGLRFPMEHPTLLQFKGAEVTHVPKQTTPFSPQFGALFLGAMCLIPAGAVAIFSQIVALFMLSGVRWKHFQLSTFMEKKGGFLVFRCWRGKRRVGGLRPSFDWAVCRWLRDGTDMFKDLPTFFEKLQSGMEGEKAFLCPDVDAGTGGMTNETNFKKKKISDSRFLELVRGLIVFLNLGDEIPANGIKTYTFRRYLTTLALALRLGSSDRAAIGDWLEKPVRKVKRQTRKQCSKCRPSMQKKDT